MDDGIVKAARIEHERQLGGIKYKSPIPADVYPKPFVK